MRERPTGQRRDARRRPAATAARSAVERHRPGRAAAGHACDRPPSAGAHPGAWWGSTAVHPLDWGAYVLLCVGPLALLAKRAYPRGVLAVVFAATATYALIGYPAGPVFLSLIVAFWFVVSRGDRVVALVCIASGWVVFLCLPWAIGTGGRPSAAQAAGLAAWLLVLLFAGEAVRSRRERVAAVRRGREQEGLRRAEEERLRIARDLHDVLAHNISLINVQSGVALHLLDERPEQARTALAVINDASAEALREIRSVLGVLRQVDERAPRRPAASLERLPDLISRSAAAGLDVDVRIDGEPRPLPSDVDLAAYRIVQESLTNVTRHARTERARVRVRYAEHELALEVDDDGSGGGDGRATGPPAGTGDGARATGPAAGTGDGGRATGSAAGTGNGSSACVSGPRRSAASSAPDRGPTAASASARDCRWEAGHDPGAARRRPGARPRRLSRVVGRAAGDRGGRRGRRRRASRAPGDRADARRRADGHPDADPRRPGGDTDDHRGSGADGDPGGDPDHVRARRVRVRGDPFRRVRVPGQGHRARRSDRGDPRWSPAAMRCCRPA